MTPERQSLIRDTLRSLARELEREGKPQAARNVSRAAWWLRHEPEMDPDQAARYRAALRRLGYTHEQWQRALAGEPGALRP